MKIETAIRYELPIVFLVTNNDGWLSALKGFVYGKSFAVLKNKKNQKWGVTDFIPDQMQSLQKSCIVSSQMVGLSLMIRFIASTSSAWG